MNILDSWTSWNSFSRKIYDIETRTSINANIRCNIKSSLFLILHIPGQIFLVSFFIGFLYIFFAPRGLDHHSQHDAGCCCLESLQD